MNEKIEKYISQMEKAAGASLLELQKSESELGFKFPEEYANFLSQTNGAEGAIGEAAYLVLWSIENVGSLNKAYKVNEYAPYLTLFGSNGGGTAFAFDRRLASLPIVEIEFMDIGLEEPKLLGQTFLDFLELKKG